MIAYIVTGVSRGIGSAIAETVIASRHQLLSLSSIAEKNEPLWRNIKCDLSIHAELRPKMEQLFHAVSLDRFDELVLINNAGVLEPIGPIEMATDERLVNNVTVNVAAPAILISAFIRLSRQYDARRRIINISSGAARHPYAGWTMYCASKAALDMLTLCVAQEQQHFAQDSPVSICSVSPGKVETDMQRNIRGCNPAVFPAQPDFVKAKNQGNLLSPGQVAELIVALDKAGEFKNGGIYDLRSAVADGQRYAIRPMNTLTGC